MTYAEQAEKAEKAGEVVRLTSSFYKLVEGEVLIGKFISRTLINSKDKKLPDYYRYQIDTDEGPLDVLLSGAFDRDYGGSLKPGGVYRFTHKGKVPLKGGHSWSDIETAQIAPPPDIEEADSEDGPF